MTTGLRRGELLGLKWSDIDLEKGDLRVRRQIGRIMERQLPERWYIHVRK